MIVSITAIRSKNKVTSQAYDNLELERRLTESGRKTAVLKKVGRLGASR